MTYKQITFGALLSLVFPFSAAKADETSVLTIGQNEPYERSQIAVSSVVHSVNFQPQAMRVDSTWSISYPDAMGNKLVFGFEDEVEGAAITNVSINGAAVQFLPVAGSKTYFQASLPTAQSNSKTAKLLIQTLIKDEEPEAALHVISAFQLPKPARLISYGVKLGWDLRPTSRHSYGDVIPTTFNAKHPSEWFAIGSSPAKQDVDAKSNQVRTSFAELSSGRFTVAIGRRQYWKVEEFDQSGATFSLVSRIKDPVLDVKLVREVAGDIFPAYLSRFKSPTDHIVIVDIDWAPVSGGLLGNNIVGLFAKQTLTTEDKDEFQAIFGKEAAASSKATIEKFYADSKNPWRTYLTGALAHELAHLYFGFGRTTERIGTLHELWFSLGMGLVYDEIVTKSITGKQDIFLAAVENNWRSKFSTDPKVDQRLIKPDTTLDKAAGLSRAHVYAHGKALAVFRDLRKQLGEEKFDALMVNYLNAECRSAQRYCAKAGEYGGYAHFRDSLLKVYPNLPKFERTNTVN